MRHIHGFENEDELHIMIWYNVFITKNEKSEFGGVHGVALEHFLKFHEGEFLSETEIADFEKAFNLKLPEGMKCLYRKQNGGYLKKCGNSLFDLPLRVLYPIGKSFDSHVPTINRLLEEQKNDGFIPMKFLPFCSDKAGDDYYVRIDEEKYGTVYYLFSEFLDDFLEEPENYIVANTFDEFMEMVDALEG